MAFHVTAFTLDEALLEQSAVHYTSGLPHSLLHDADARATDRLYSLVLSVAFHFFAASNAIRIDHVLSVILFVSTAAPVYLLATKLRLSRPASAAAAALSVAVPWLALTSALFTENLSYPLFWWTMLAVARTIEEPSRWRDLQTLIGVGLLVVTRVQFVAVFAGYLLALVAVVYWRAPATLGVGARTLSAIGRMARDHTFTLAVLIVCVAVLAYARASGQWTQHVETLLGSYSNVVVGKAIPPNMVEALGVEIIALALGVGLLPAFVSVSWYLKSIGSSLRQDRRLVLVTLGVMLATFLLLTVFSQLGYLGAMTEERYFFYVIPAFWIGTFAALEDRNVRPGEIALCALGFAFLYGAIPFVTTPFGQEIAFLAPVESIAAHVYSLHEAAVGLGSLTLQDALALLAVLSGVITAVIWERWTTLRRWWIVGFAAVVQLLFTSYAYAVIDGAVPGIAGRTEGNVAALGWVDAHSHGMPVWWFDNLALAPPPVGAAPAEYEERTALFWNSDLRSWAALPATGLPQPIWPMTALPNEPTLSIDPADGDLAPSTALRSLHEAVDASNSAFFQLAGTSVVRSPNGALSLVRVSQPARVTWLAEGLQPDGFLIAGDGAHVWAFAPASSTSRSMRVTLTFAPAPAPAVGADNATSMLVRFGATAIRLRMSGSSPRSVSLTACFPSGSSVSGGTLTATQSVPVDGQDVAGVLQSVAISSPSPSHCRANAPSAA